MIFTGSDRGSQEEEEEEEEEEKKSGHALVSHGVDRGTAGASVVVCRA